MTKTFTTTVQQNGRMDVSCNGEVVAFVSPKPHMVTFATGKTVSYTNKSTAHQVMCGYEPRQRARFFPSQKKGFEFVVAHFTADRAGS